MEMFNPKDTEWAAFPEEYTDFILMRDHRMFSLCPHHLLPVKMFVSIAYIPDGKVLGLSKLARIAHECNRGPVLQEAFTSNIVNAIEFVCKGVKGAACLVEGHHGCMEMRGIKSDGHVFTYKFTGTFADNVYMQDRFLGLCRTPRT